MAVSKGLKPFLDVDAKGQYKKTRKNISKMLTYYGYEIKDIQNVFGAKNDIYSRYIDEDMEKRERVTARVYFTEEEQEIIQGYEEDIDRVYAELTSSGNTVTPTVNDNKRKKVKVSKPESSNNRKKVSKPNAKTSMIGEGLREEEITSSNLLNKLQQISEKDTSETRDKIKENRQEVQRPVRGNAPTDGKCSHCEGRGWVMEKQDDGRVRKVVCPKCLGNPVKAESEDFDRYGKPLLEELIENRYYLNNRFDTHQLIEDNMDAYRVATRQFENYVEFISGVLTEVRNGEIPLKSYYLATPDGYGKKHFVYQVMKELVAYGNKPTQLLNGGLLLDLYNKREFKEINDLLEGDMIFVTISALSRTNGLGNVIKYIADVAERKGVPVIMIGRVSVEVFLRDKDYNLPSLLGRQTSNGDYGHFQCEGFFGKDFNALARLQQERMSGSLVSRN